MNCFLTHLRCSSKYIKFVLRKKQIINVEIFNMKINGILTKKLIV